MPPVNTPARSPTGPPTPPHSAGRPLTPLSYLSSPAPDLASTLHTSQAADEADEANVSFLRDSLGTLDQDSLQRPRTHIEPQRDPRRSTYRADNASAATAPHSRSQETPEDVSRRERLQRVLFRLNRYHESGTSSASAYSNRTPSPNRQSLYDWAPSHIQSSQHDAELDAILLELRNQQPDTHSDILRVLGQSQLERRREHQRNDSLNTTTAGDGLSDAAERRQRLRERERRTRSENEWASLRSRAALQRARQEGAGSPSATERMLRYVMERERSGMSEEEERARGSGWLRPNPTRPTDTEEPRTSSNVTSRERWTLPPPAELEERDRQERAESFRRNYLPSPRTSTPPVPSSSVPPLRSLPLMENALKYLSELRSCTRYEEVLSAAIDHGLATKEFFAEKHDDFVMDLDELSPLSYSSWLQPGAVFEGHQHATTSSSNLTHRGPASAASHIEQINPNYRGSPSATSTGFDHPPGSTRVTPFDPSRPWQFSSPSRNPTSASKESHDQWPVRVIIHSVDDEKMTLQGTMEAYDVPQHPSSLSILNSPDRPKAGKKSAPITTYLEGHIIDVRTHSFLTPEAGSAKRRRRSDATAAGAGHATFTSRTSTVDDEITFPSADPTTDAHNWLKLPPFSHLASSRNKDITETSEEVSRILLSRARLEALHSEYIFMRWKERCFVHTRDSKCTASATERTGDQDRGHGLTISGFYYVSLRRSDGKVEGLYFDPISTPHQHLRLIGSSSGWGSWEFR